MKEYGIWLDFPTNKPDDGERVLALRNSSRLWWDVVVYNEYHECWDDSEGDDYFCDLDEVEKFMRIPKSE